MWRFEDNQFTGNGMLINSMAQSTGQFSGLPEDGVEEQANGVRYFGSWSNGERKELGQLILKWCNSGRF